MVKAEVSSWLNVGRRIRALRKANQLTLKQLAAGSDLSPNAISLLERGKVAPTIATVCKIASALGVPASSLFQEVCPTNSTLDFPTRFLCTADADQEEFDAAEYPLYYISSANQTVQCILGSLEYEVEGGNFLLDSGESLTVQGGTVFRCHNKGSETAALVIIIPPEKQNEKEAHSQLV